MAVESEKGKMWPQYRAVLSSLFAMFNSGLHFGWPSPFLPRIMSEEYPFNITESEASNIASIGPIGDIFGSILFPAIVDSIGRKNTILLIALPQITSTLMIALSHYSVLLLYFARFIGGLSEAACFTILPLYIGEISEPEVRGKLGSYFSFFLILGIFTVNLVGSFLDTSTSAMIFTVLPVIFLLAFCRMPESPYYLIMKNRIKEAEESLQNLRGKFDVENELKSLIKDVKRQMGEKGSYIDLIKLPANRKACIVMMGIRTIQQFSGVSAFTLYMQLLLEKSTDLLFKSTASNLIFLTQLFFNFLATLLIDRTGRKPLLLVSTLGCCAVLLLEGIFFALKDFLILDLERFSYLPAVGIIVYIMAFAIGLGNVVNLMTGELFSSSVKAKASSIMNILFGVLMTCSTKFYQYTADNISLSVPFFVFAFCLVLGAVFCWVYVPETKGKTLEEIQQELAESKS